MNNVKVAQVDVVALVVEGVLAIVTHRAKLSVWDVLELVRERAATVVVVAVQILVIRRAQVNALGVRKVVLHVLENVKVHVARRVLNALVDVLWSALEYAVQTVQLLAGSPDTAGKTKERSKCGRA